MQGLGEWCVRRGCFYSCSGCFQLSGRQQEVDYIHLPDAVVVERWIWVECKKRLGIVVANGFERREFALERHFIFGASRRKFSLLMVRPNGIIQCSFKFIRRLRIRMHLRGPRGEGYEAGGADRGWKDIRESRIYS